jgi:hypothetical protein
MKTVRGVARVRLLGPGSSRTTFGRFCTRCRVEAEVSCSGRGAAGVAAMAVVS